MHSAKNGNRFVLLLMLTIIFGSFTISSIVYSKNIDLNIYLNVLLSQWVLIFIPILLYFFITKSPIIETSIIRKIKIINILLCIALSWSLIPLLALINLISQLFVTNYIGNTMLEAINEPLWALLLIIAVTPAIVEELAMRSIVISNYREQYYLKTCLISGLFFGMFHLNINQFCYAFVMGFIFCLVVHITGSVLSSMIMHFTINATMVTAEKVVMKLNELFMGKDLMSEFSDIAIDSTYIISVLPVFIVLALLSIPFILLLLYALIKYNKKENILKVKLTTKEILNLSSKEINIKKDSIVTPSFIFIIVTFIIYVSYYEFIL